MTTNDNYHEQPDLRCCLACAWYYIGDELTSEADLPWCWDEDSEIASTGICDSFKRIET